MTKRTSQHLQLLIFLSLVLLLLGRGLALAAADAPPSPDVDAAEWAKALYAAVTSKDWGIVAGIALIGVVYPARRWGPEVFKTKLGGLLLAFGISLAGTMGLALAAGAKPTLSLTVTAITTAATAAGVWEWLKAHFGLQPAADKASA